MPVLTFDDPKTPVRLTIDFSGIKKIENDSQPRRPRELLNVFTVLKDSHGIEANFEVCT
ncbi:hypothetical protein VD0002_g227 [Verticillium dahliae]|uniref:Uncharacterized protein n=1 Tax=Verticillium dahliae TaxID=27337 RepID=A0AA44WAH6_VERDA|nr:hypothetical protein BJF96_g9835 [Verticillium dahliae]PNH44395.1 hypothetical protein VD0004_g3307 [Verticillium dahliae]PNH55482.1 hypothetical protein VD0003_g2149 [Verticillium dahliae]PNH70400.1 hypothetical protein VD0002_g227 [Verticillium dahliae]PNH75930.1 hypothetical protein VD0001_g1594 [Verticillium dahliae]